MAIKFNPLTGNFDFTGSGGGGGGASYIDGEVANFAALPTSSTTAPLDSAWLVRTATGTWFTGGSKPAGIYIRTATTGTLATDWTYAGTLPDVFSDAFTLYDDADTSKNLKFNLSSISTGTTRTLTAPNASGRIQVEGQPIGNTTPAAGTFTTLAATTSLTLGTSGILSGGTNTIEQRNTTSGQTFRIYNTVSGTNDANYERGFMRWSSNILQIGSEAAGTGSNRNVSIISGAYTYSFSTSAAFSSPGDILVTGTGKYFWQGRGRMYATADGIFALANNFDTDFGRICFGGTTSAFPALKRSSTAMQVRLADDSAYSVIDAQHRLQGTAPASATATGTAGDIRYDGSYIYVCSATNTWVRAALATW